MRFVVVLYRKKQGYFTHLMDKPIDKKLIRRERRRKQLLWGTGAGVVVVAAGWLVSDIAPTINSNDITVAATDRGALDVTVAATGQIVPAYEEIINSPVNSRVLKIFAQPGDTVEAGMPLLELDLEQEQMKYK